MRGDQAAVLANAGWGLAGGWLGPRAPGNLAPAPAAERTACTRCGHCAEIRCTVAQEVAMAQLELLPGSGGRLSPRSFFSLLTRICESCCQVRYEPHGKFQLHSRKRIHCWLTGGHLLSLVYARPTWDPREKTETGRLPNA